MPPAFILADSEKPGTGSRHVISAVRLPLLDEELLVRGEPQLLARHLLPAEQRLFARFRHAKRKIEWLGGRLAAKHALGRLTAEGVEAGGWHDWIVLAENDGRPFAEYTGAAGPKETPALSISHSHGMAVAMAATARRCGIDIQAITPTVNRIQERFATGPELAILAAAGLVPPAGAAAQEAALTLLWAAKEALRKAAAPGHLPGFLEMELTATEKTSGRPECMRVILHVANRGGSLLGKSPAEQYRVTAWYYENFAMAFIALSDDNRF